MHDSYRLSVLYIRTLNKTWDVGEQTFHESVRIYSLKFKEQLGRFNYLTPTSFLELISSFQVKTPTTKTSNSSVSREL